jgi:hypothetical protein
VSICGGYASEIKHEQPYCIYPGYAVLKKFGTAYFLFAISLPLLFPTSAASVTTGAVDVILVLVVEVNVDVPVTERVCVEVLNIRL